MALSINIKGFSELTGEILDRVMAECSVIQLIDSNGQMQVYYGHGGFVNSTKTFIIYRDCIRFNVCVDFELSRVSDILIQDDIITMTIDKQHNPIQLIGKISGIDTLCDTNDLLHLKFPKNTIAKTGLNPDVIYIQTERIGNLKLLESSKICNMLVKRYGLMDDENYWIDTPLAIAFTKEGEKIKIGLIDRMTGEFISRTRSFLWQNYYSIN